MVPKEFIQPEGLSQPSGYTHVAAVRGGKMIFISGQVALDENGRIIGEGDLRTQIVQVYKNLEVALQAAGAGFEDVLKQTIFVVNYKPADRDVIVEIRDRFLSKENPPASTLLGVQSLARPEYLVEIEAVAVVE